MLLNREVTRPPPKKKLVQIKNSHGDFLDGYILLVFVDQGTAKKGVNC